MPLQLLGYLLRAIGSRVVVALPALCLIYLAFHLGDQGRLLARELGWSPVLRASLLHLPLVAVQVLPAVVLLSCVLAYHGLRRRGELEALVIRGLWSGWHVLPILLTGAAGALGALALDELVVPACEQWADQLQGPRASPLTGLVAPPAWRRRSTTAGETWFFHREGQGPLLALQVDGGFRAIRRVDGRAPGRVTVTRFDGIGFARRPERDLNGPGLASLREGLRSIGGAGADGTRAEALSAPELRRRLALLDAAGQLRPAERLVFHTKLAFPLINLVVALLACSFALRRGRPTPVRDLALAVALLLLLWLLLATGWVLGRSGILPAALGAWGAVGLGLLLGSAALVRGLRALR